jgi:hypothetical protein
VQVHGQNAEPRANVCVATVFAMQTYKKLDTRMYR